MHTLTPTGGCFQRWHAIAKLPQQTGFKPEARRFVQWNKPDGSDLSFMSKETPKDDPRQQTDWKNTKQTDQPWKGATEKEQLDPDRPKPDLEKWHDTSTH
jgi:hypothetical protein